MPPTLILIATPQYCDGAYIKKGGTNNKKQEKRKKMKKKLPKFPSFQ
jgi:hypothetical protein